MPQSEVERRERHGRRRLPNWAIGVIALVLVIVGPYLAFTGHVPFTGYGYQLHAVFRNDVNVSKGSPVRIAGVNVGTVLSVSKDGNASEVTFTVDGAGRPVNDDARVQIRPRIFFEGNWFLELEPGSPSAAQLPSGGTIPITRTSTAVQLDQILNALQSPVRANLQRLLVGYGTALTHMPNAAEDATQVPSVKGLTAAGALNQAFRYGGPAGRYSAQVLQALRGTSPHDLSLLVDSAGSVFHTLQGHERQLQGLITNFDIFTGSLAAQSRDLALTVKRLAPTLVTAHRSLADLNASLPALRTYAIELRPAIAELPALIRSAGPWLDQALPLLSESEGGGVARLLRLATPGLAGASSAGLKTLPQIGDLSLCTSRVLVPTGQETINDPFSTGPNYREFFYSTAGIAGESQNFDGNGQAIHVQAGGGPQLVQANNPNPVVSGLPHDADTPMFGNTIAAPQGTAPARGAQPPFKGKAKCFKQPVPDLNGSGSSGPPSPVASP